MRPLENLARRMCWLEFGSRPPKEFTEALYWKSISEASRQEHVNQARIFLIWIETSRRSMRFDQLVAAALLERAGTK